MDKKQTAIWIIFVLAAVHVVIYTVAGMYKLSWDVYTYFKNHKNKED